MKILLFYINLNQGGVQRMMVNVANFFDHKGDEVTFFLARDQGQYRENLNPGVKILSAETDNRFKLLFKLRTLLRKHEFDTMFTAVPHFNIIALLAKAFANANCKLILSERSNTLEEFKESPWGMYKLSFFLIPILYRFANGIVAVSHGVADDLAKVALISKKNISVIYNPAFNRQMHLNRHLEVAFPWPKDEETKFLIGVGRLTPQKDFGTLIQALNYIPNPKVKLIIVGEGDELEKLTAYSEALGLTDRVFFAGFQLNPIAWIAKCDVFVLSSLWEGFGNIVVEALAAGVTIVSTDCKSGPSEIIEQGKYGYLTPVGNPEEMAKTIQRALESPMDMAAQISRAEMFDVDIILKNYEVLFKN
ncbi:glycosyltransferase [Belliella kenyensis]|uniref:Glycosyltransferase n=1 Tax=Belliella kenyensis TaxID=1472724 RepID=A0ABV8EKE8_9BACT|nr:glycosyltransferase [Belliella kenyensis]MCH7400525.1 glycosyltransferase [Belliella kenyensis]MDN3604459.1 glycosyltransferase [Belliella kenyensis]